MTTPGHPAHPQPWHPQQHPMPPYAQQPAPYGYGYPAPMPPHPTMHAAVAVTRAKKPTNHLLHLILTVCTGTLWGWFVWLPITIWHAAGVNKQKTVTTLR